MQIPILSGIYTDQGPDVRQSYPVNMMAVPQETGVSAGYLRPADGLVQVGTGPGATRGGILWEGVLYRVMGTKLVSIATDGTVTTIGDVEGTETVQMTFGFDYLAIASNKKLWLYDGSTLAQVTDVNLGEARGVQWIDGYFMTHDAESLVVGDLTNPFSINPLKYGSSEASPDEVVALLRVRNEIAVLNRTTIEFLADVGGSGFPFARIEGSQIQKGCLGARACCLLLDNVAFVGGGVSEAPGIYLGANAQAQKISTLEVDRILAQFSEVELSATVLESRNADGRTQLYVHLPDRCLVFDVGATEALGKPVWVQLTSTRTVDTFEQYGARHFVWAYDGWQCGSPVDGTFGATSSSVSSHWGDVVRWEFGATMLYNESRGAQVSSLELVALTGRIAVGAQPNIGTSYSLDGLSWSSDRMIPVGTTGSTVRRLVWFGQGFFRSRRMQRFRGESTAHLAVQRLEADLQQLAW